MFPGVATGAVPFTAMPIDPVVAVVAPLNCADALSVVAPFAVALAALTLTVAMPNAFVKAVPEVGVIVISEVLATWKVTTALTTGDPFAFSKIALTLAGVLVVVKLVLRSINVMPKLAAATGTVPPPVVVVVPLAAVPPSPQAESRANAVADKITANNLWIFLL